MKRSSVILGILVSLAFRAYADESFLITVPVREITNAQTGEVRVTLGLNAPSAPGKWRVFLAAGPNFPHGGLSTRVDGVLSINAGVERLLSPDVSIEAILGRHTFDRSLLDPRMTHFSIGGKYWFRSGLLRPFLGGSIGAYYLEPGDETRFGSSGSAGLLVQLTPRFAVDGVYNVHNINNQNDSLTFSTLQAGVRLGW